MSDSEDSFILISSNNNAGSVHSIDGWSEISIPSNRSNPIKNAGAAPTNTFSVNTGTYLQNSTTSIPSFLHHTNASNSDKGYYLVSAPIHFSSNNSLTHDSTNENAGINTNNITINPNANINANASIGSVGSRVPFSWAEITKIQPQFHNQTNKPKVFDKTPKIQTRYPEKKNKPIKNNTKGIKPIIYNKNSDDTMPSIPEANTSIITPKRRRSRLRYYSGKRNKRWRKKTQKLK
eukprot:42512_1